VVDFDVHHGEAPRQLTLLGDLEEGIDRLFAGLGPSADRALVMTTSEFGRRPAENGSGTDHGTANVHFLVGPSVKGGRYGEPHHSRSSTRRTTLVPTTDFRSL
jgi:uncharacterized protein (DUF1501 family)